jgi:hypothetical protein
MKVPLQVAPETLPQPSKAENSSDLSRKPWYQAVNHFDEGSTFSIAETRSDPNPRKVASPGES